MTQLTTKQHRKGIYTLYDGQIPSMREQGLTLQKIGDKVGVTRERVRQVMKRYYPDKYHNGISSSKVAKLIGITYRRLNSLKERGVIKPSISIGRCFYYTEVDIETVRTAIKRYCIHCGDEIPLESSATKYCPKCHTNYRHNSYPFRSEEGQQKQRQANLENYYKRKKQNKETK